MTAVVSPEKTRTATTLEGFAGPGGLSGAAHMLGITNTLGIELNSDACATAQAAGHARIQANIRTLNPDDFSTATGWASAPPCPTYTDAGKRSGLADYQTVLEAIAQLGDAQANTAHDDDHATAYKQVADERSALVLETLKFAFRLPNLRWLVAEQVPAVHNIWAEMCAELAATTDWASCNVVRLRMDDFGAPTRRERVFLIAARDYSPDFSGMPYRARWSCGRFDAPRLHLPNTGTAFPRTTMAGVLGWPAGVKIRTRGNRRTPGGNLFSADGLCAGLTEKARSWTREDQPGHALTPAEAGLLQGFPRDYRWQGSRSSQFLQIANTVSPLAGAAVLGTATGLPWQDAVRERLEQIYNPDALIPQTRQLDLLSEVA